MQRVRVGQAGLKGNRIVRAQHTDGRVIISSAPNRAIELCVLALGIVCSACAVGPASERAGDERPTGRLLLAPESEPGERIQLVLTTVDGAEGFPVAGATIRLVQTDASGQYGPDPKVWNPRLVATGLTDAGGRLLVDSIRPGAYKDDEGNSVPVHVHFTASAVGYRTFAAETPLEDDPRFDAKARAAAAADGLPIARRTSPAGGMPVYEAHIPLQRD